MIINLHHCPLADRDHAASLRQYAHAGHHENTVCVCDAFFSLPEFHQLGLIAHELGHILMFPGMHSEGQANRAAREAFGVKVRHRDGRYGEDLQWLDRRDCKRMKKILGRV